MGERATLHRHVTTVFQIIGGRWAWSCACDRADVYDTLGAAARSAEQHKSRWLIGCVTGRHADDGRCLCASEMARLQTRGLDELDAVALLLGHTPSVPRASSGDADDVRDNSTNKHVVFRHDNIVSDESNGAARG